MQKFTTFFCVCVAVSTVVHSVLVSVDSNETAASDCSYTLVETPNHNIKLKVDCTSPIAFVQQQNTSSTLHPSWSGMPGKKESKPSTNNIAGAVPAFTENANSSSLVNCHSARANDTLNDTNNFTHTNCPEFNISARANVTSNATDSHPSESLVLGKSDEETKGSSPFFRLLQILPLIVGIFLYGLYEYLRSKYLLRNMSNNMGYTRFGHSGGRTDEIPLVSLRQGEGSPN